MTTRSGSGMEAALFLTLGTLALRLTRFGAQRRLWGQAGRQAPDPRGEATVIAQHVGQRVSAVARLMPWDCHCLEQAAATKLMLRRRGIGSTVVFGCLQDHGALRSHAWVRVGDRVVVGQKGHELYTPVQVYAD